MEAEHAHHPAQQGDNVIHLDAFRAHREPMAPAVAGRSAEDPLVRHLAGGERLMKPATEQLLVEIDTCGMEDISNAATRAEYLRMIRDFAHFVGAFGHDLITAAPKHVTQFKAHLSRDDDGARRLTELCPFCQGSGRRAGGYSPSYVKRHLAAIKAGYAYLVADGLVVADPSATVKRPKVEPLRQYVPSLEEVRRLFDYPGTARSRLLVRLAYYPPARRFELATLRWADIDDFAVWHFPAKGDEQHGLKLHPEVLRALRHYREHQRGEAERHPAMRAALADPETAYVLLTKGGKSITPGHLVRILKRHAVRAGVAVVAATAVAKDPKTGEAWDCIDGKTSRVSPHALRRAGASHALNDAEEAVPIDVVSKVLNHTSIETTRRRYAFTDDDRAWEALTKRRLA